MYSIKKTGTQHCYVTFFGVPPSATHHISLQTYPPHTASYLDPTSGGRRLSDSVVRTKPEAVGLGEGKTMASKVGF
jgi:hypothetical protein